MGDSATRLAVRLLGNVAQGRGRTLPLDTVSSQSLVPITAVVISGIYTGFHGR